jgi:hypothetical protein
VLGYMLSPVLSIRVSAMGLMKRLIKRGLVLHAKVISHLIAVHLSHYGHGLAQDALSLITDGALEIPSIGFHIGEAINLVARFSEDSGIECRGWVVSPVSCKESTLVRLWSIVREQKQARNNFLFSLARLFDRGLSKTSAPKQGETDATSLCFVAARFVCEAVASMPFQKEDEVMIFISRLNNTIGGHLVSDVLNQSKDSLQSSASSRAASQVLVDNLRRCEIGIKLFQLKSFLKSFYHISEAKLLSFTGTEAMSKFASCSSKMSVHAADLSAPFAIPNVAEEWEASTSLFDTGKSLRKYLKKLFYDHEHETSSVELFSRKHTRKRKAPNSTEVTDSTSVGNAKPRAAKRRKTKQTEEEDYADDDDVDKE